MFRRNTSTAGDERSSSGAPLADVRFLAAMVLLLAFAAFESGTAIAKDDFGYLMWGLQTRGDLLAWVEGPEWFTYRRPLNALLWWLSAQTGIDGELVRWSQVGLWTLFGAALLLPVRGCTRGVVTMLLLLTTNQVFVDLLHWRSWVTTTGCIAFLALAALAIERRAAPLTVAMLGILALGFKEVGAVAIAVLALTTPGYRWVGALLIGALAAGSASSAHKLGLHFLPDNLRFHVETLALFAPAVPVLVAVRFPRLPSWALALTAGMVFLPAPVRAAAFLLAASLVLVKEARWLPSAGVAFVLPLVGAYHARQYLLEAWAVVLIAVASGKRLAVPNGAWLAMLLLALPSAVDFETNRASLRRAFAEQRAFLRDFHPPPAAALYHPDPMWSWDLDALYWVRAGASLEGRPPEGTSPVQVGPLSGVWAGVRVEGGKGR